MPRRARQITFLAGTGAVTAIVLVLALGDPLACYHSWRLRLDPEHLRRILDRPDNTAERRAILTFMLTEVGARSLVRLILRDLAEAHDAVHRPILVTKLGVRDSGIVSMERVGPRFDLNVQHRGRRTGFSSQVRDRKACTAFELLAELEGRSVSFQEPHFLRVRVLRLQEGLKVHYGDEFGKIFRPTFLEAYPHVLMIEPAQRE